ncbi:MAG: VTT domain-containing protein [Alphaproteobacteria bacterium]|nr:VTT domain-containing protein [Alphaproteobacteria bacterium]
MRLIDSILDKSSKKWYSWVVCFMTICESIFLFIPPEVFMTPAIVANKRRTVPVTVAAAVGSVIGGAIAYAIGYWLFDSVGIWLIEHFATMEKFLYTKDMFTQYGILIIILTAVTPIPYKLLAICAGFMKYPLFIFLLVSAIFRTGRFGIIGFLLWKFQEKANELVKKYSLQITIGAIVFALLGLGILYLI